MPKKKKAAGEKPPPEPDPPAVVRTSEDVDFEASDGEVGSTSPPPPPTSAMHRRRFALTRSCLLGRHLRPSSDEILQPEDSLEALIPGALAILLWEEETKASVRAIRENGPQTPLSVGSAAVALTISRQEAAAHEAAMVSEIGPVLPTSTTTPEDNSSPSSISATDVSVPASPSIAVDSVVSTDSTSTTRAAVQRAGVGQPLVAPQTPLPSVTNPDNPTDEFAAAVSNPDKPIVKFASHSPLTRRRSSCCRHCR